MPIHEVSYTQIIKLWEISFNTIFYIYAYIYIYLYTYHTVREHCIVGIYMKS